MSLTSTAIRSRLSSSDLRLSLLHDHENLEDTSERVLKVFRNTSGDDAEFVFIELERRLTTHLAYEERLIFPHFARVDPLGAAALREEHDAIRVALRDIGNDVSHHLLTSAKTRELLELLRNHSRRENTLMYRWAEKNLPFRSRTSVLRGLREGRSGKNCHTEPACRTA